MTYDNTDERGEDAVARQRGGSERPQHVDTCRVYNCYGCEEIMDEPGHLPEVQRWTTERITEEFSLDEGEWVAYADHVAALRACEARAQGNRLEMWAEGYAFALHAARDAVAALTAMDDRGGELVYRAYALAAIDALRATP